MKNQALVGLLGFTIVLGFILSSSPISAESRSASVTVGSACTLSAVENTAHTATIPSGTNQSDIGRTTFSMVCNDSGGFSIYAIGYGSNELGNTKLIASINGSAAPSYDINTGSNASGTPSSWAMKLTPGTNLTSSNILNGYGSYSVIPSVYTKVTTLVPSTAVTNTSTLEATYRVNVASTQPAGNYNGKVRYVMVNPNTNVPNQPRDCSANSICYWPNGGDTTAIAQGGVGVPDTMGDQSIASSATSAMLWASNFKRPGYGFAGWSDAYDYIVNVGSESNPDAHIYGPNETIEFTAGQYSSPNNGLSLYAVWVKSEGNLQGWNGCSSLGQDKITALTDLRDNDTYAVAKLVDGKCWMIENLRLDYDADFTESLSQGFGGVFAGLARPETVFSDSSATANNLYSTDGSTIYNIGNADFPEYRIPRYNNNNTNINSTINTNTNVSNMTGMDQNVYGYGNYYSWAAIKANTGNLSSATNSNASSTSICPSGWRLPKGGDKSLESNNDFWKLVVTGLNGGNNPANYSNSAPYYSGATEANPLYKLLRTYPNNFINSGHYDSDGVTWRGTRSYYWSSTATTSTNAYYFVFYSTRIWPGTTNLSKTDAIAVRCLIGN